MNRDSWRRLHVVYSFKSGKEKLVEINIPKIGEFYNLWLGGVSNCNKKLSLSGDCGLPYQEGKSCLVNCNGGPFGDAVPAAKVCFYISNCL